MKLSEAILKGCEMTRPLRDTLSKADRECDGRLVFRTCALGAAMVGAGMYRRTEVDFEKDWDDRDLKRKYPAILERIEKCPTKLKRPCPNIGSVGELVAHLNDDHAWRRESIAMWIESLEKLVEAKNGTRAVAPAADAGNAPDCNAVVDPRVRQGQEVQSVPRTV